MRLEPESLDTRQPCADFCLYPWRMGDRQANSGILGMRETTFLWYLFWVKQSKICPSCRLSFSKQGEKGKLEDNMWHILTVLVQIALVFVILNDSGDVSLNSCAIIASNVSFTLILSYEEGKDWTLLPVFLWAYMTKNSLKNIQTHRGNAFNLTMFSKESYLVFLLIYCAHSATAELPLRY